MDQFQLHLKRAAGWTLEHLEQFASLPLVFRVDGLHLIEGRFVTVVLHAESDEDLQALSTAALVADADSVEFKH